MTTFQIISIIVTLSLAIGGGVFGLVSLLMRTLIKKYFEALETRIAKLERDQKLYQEQMMASIRSIDMTLSGLSQWQKFAVTQPDCSRREVELRDQFMKGIASAKNEIYIEAEAMEERLERRLDGLENLIRERTR